MGIFDKLKTGARGMAEEIRNRAQQSVSGNGLDAIALLRQQHRDVERLFLMIAEARGRRRQTLFNELADAVALHAEIEEQFFYPAANGARTEELLLESVEEHLSVKRLLSDMLEIDQKDDSFDAKLKVLKDQIEHHVEEEEDELFPEAQTLLGNNRLLELGAQMEAMVAVLQDAEPRLQVPDQTDAPAPI